MNKRILFLASSLSMLLAIHQVSAQTLGGSYTVGVGMDYPTLTSAVAAYNSSTLIGPVVFNLTDLEYQLGETYPITINHNSSASNVNTLTIKPALGNTSCTIKGILSRSEK